MLRRRFLQILAALTASPLLSRVGVRPAAASAGPALPVPCDLEALHRAIRFYIPSQDSSRCLWVHKAILPVTLTRPDGTHEARTLLTARSVTWFQAQELSTQEVHQALRDQLERDVLAACHVGNWPSVVEIRVGEPFTPPPPDDFVAIDFPDVFADHVNLFDPVREVRWSGLERIPNAGIRSLLEKARWRS